jgi:signal transduction histidine kinase
LITLFPAWLNALLRRNSWLLLADLLFCASLFALTGGWSTPYYLYAFSPLLAAAFFSRLRGALLTAAGMAGLFVSAGIIRNASANESLLGLVAQVVGFFLIAGTFGYATTLLAQLQASHADLRRAHRDLEVIHSLTLSLQSAADINEVEERVLAAVTDELGFPRAMVALVDQDDQAITAWLGRSKNGQPLLTGAMPHPARVPVTPEAGLIAAAILDGQPRLAVQDIVTTDERLNRNLKGGAFHVFPMLLRGHPVGVLLVDGSDGDDKARLNSLQSIASQAAVAVGTTMLCIDRAQRLAVQDERIRIAREIHDTLSQSLFGMSYALDACMKLLPGKPEQVKGELASITHLAETARSQLRESIMDIWPSEITAESFVSDLRKYVREHCRSDGLELETTINGDFKHLPARTRRDLYRIAQEAITNITRHAKATQASVCMKVNHDETLLAVRDNGRGFEVASVLARERDREHFGLRGIEERAARLGGTTEFLSQLGAGATVLVELPIDGRSTRG